MNTCRIEAWTSSLVSYTQSFEITHVHSDFQLTVQLFNWEILLLSYLCRYNKRSIAKLEQEASYNRRNRSRTTIPPQALASTGHTQGPKSKQYSLGRSYEPKNFWFWPCSNFWVKWNSCKYKQSGGDTVRSYFSYNCPLVMPNMNICFMTYKCYLCLIILSIQWLHGSWICFRRPILSKVWCLQFWCAASRDHKWQKKHRVPWNWEFPQSSWICEENCPFCFILVFLHEKHDYSYISCPWIYTLPIAPVHSY
jgi:hypothetical protein